MLDEKFWEEPVVVNTLLKLSYEEPEAHQRNVSSRYKWPINASSPIWETYSLCQS